jgi:hypothetical protein
MTDTVGMASGTKTNGEPAPQSTLLGLPAEFRNEIYLLVAAGSTRPLLVSRLMHLQATRKSSPDKKIRSTLETLLDSAVGLHLLNQTCRQLRDEFQPLFLHASEPYHRLILNNFDVAQTEFVIWFLYKYRARGLRTKDVRGYTSHSGVAHKVKVEFLGDGDIVKSADAFLQHIIAKCDLREHLTKPMTRPAIGMVLGNRQCMAL